jgi:hypothetical protein
VPEQFLGEGVLATAPPYPTTGCFGWSRENKGDVSTRLSRKKLLLRKY